jgi:hypothetical protein
MCVWRVWERMEKGWAEKELIIYDSRVSSRCFFTSHSTSSLFLWRTLNIFLPCKCFFVGEVRELWLGINWGISEEESSGRFREESFKVMMGFWGGDLW